MAKGGGGPTVSTYYVAIHFILGMGAFDKILKFLVSEKEAWSGSAMDTTITIDAPELFGGNSREGGIKGDVDIMSGKATQTKNTYLMSALGNDIPAYRQVTSVVLKQIYIGTNYYLKPWAIVAERIHSRLNGLTQWHDEIAEIGSGQGLMNIVHMVRECLTDPYWGRGLPESLIDETTFYSAAQTIYNEGLGFAVYWSQESTIEDFIIELLKHIQASLYRDRKTGKYKLVLIRKLASTVGVYTVNDTNSKNIAEIKRKSIGDLVSQVEVKFLNNETNKDDTVIVSDASLASRQGEPKKDSITYIACATKDVAHKLAVRDLQQRSFPVIAVNGLEVDRTAEDLYVGAPFILDRSDYFPSPILMRVVQISLGDAINGRITIEAVQDNFQAADIVYPALPSSSWVNPILPPQAATIRTVFEVPYYMIAKNKGDAYAQGVNSLKSFMVAACASPSDISYSAGIWTTTGTDFKRRGAVDFCCTGTLAASLDRTSTSFTVNNLQDEILLEVGTFIKVGNEFMGLVARSTNTFTVKRGVLDTIPLAHSAGTRIFGVQDYSSTDNVEYFIGETVKVKLTPKTPKGEYPVTSASEDSLTMLGRMHLPYPPGNLKINGSTWPATLVGGADPDLLLLVRGNGANNGTTFTDLSSIGASVTAIGSANTSTDVGDPYGTNIGVIEVIGTSGLVIPYNPNYTLGLQQFAISCYVYVLGYGAPTIGGNITLFYVGQRNASSPYGGFGCYLLSNYIVFEDVKNTGSAVNTSVSYSVPINTWTHIRVQRTATTIETYVNGIKISGQTSTFLTNNLGNPNNLPLYIGVSGSGTDITFFQSNHYISDFKIKLGTVTSGNFTPPPIPTQVGNINLTYTSRNRLQQTVSLLDYYSGNITSEAGVTYKAELRRTDTNALLDAVSGITDLAMPLSTAYIGNVNLKIWSVNANGECFYPVSHTFNLT